MDVKGTRSEKMNFRHFLSGICLAVAVMFLMSVSIHPAMAAEAVNEQLGCTTCGEMTDLYSIPGLENVTAPIVSVREISPVKSGNVMTGLSAGKAPTAGGIRTWHSRSGGTFTVQDPRIRHKVPVRHEVNNSLVTAGVQSEITDPALQGAIANMSSAGYDFDGISSHRYESTLQSDDLISLNASQKQALTDGGFVLTADDTVLSYRDANYYTFTNRITQNQRYLSEIQRLDASGNPTGEREYAISPEFRPDGTAVNASRGSKGEEMVSASASGERMCFWEWFSVVLAAVAFLIVVALYIIAVIASDGGALVPALSAIIFTNTLIGTITSRLYYMGSIEMSEAVVYVGDSPKFFFAASTLNTLTAVGLVILVLLLYAIYQLGVCKEWWPVTLWENYEWDHEGGDFGRSDNGKTKELWQHDRFQVSLMTDTSADPDARWVITSHSDGLAIRKNSDIPSNPPPLLSLAAASIAAPEVPKGNTKIIIAEATELGPQELTLEYRTKKPVPPAVKSTRYTLTLTVTQIPFVITTVDSTAKKAGVGEYNSLVIDKSGIPHISYYDAVEDRILYASYVNNVWTSEKVADTHGTYATSLSFDPAGNPAISFGDGKIYGNLMYAHKNGSAWSVETVDNGGTIGNVGQFSSLVIDPAGTPHITYNDGRIAADMMYAVKSGDTWKISTIAKKGNTGYDSSLVLDSAGLPHVAYRDRDYLSNLMYAHMNALGVWTVTKVDKGGSNGRSNTGATGWWPSIALDSAGNPHISYYDKGREYLMYSSWEGTAWKIEPVHTTGNVGKYSSLAIDSRDQPFISYYDAGRKELRFATRNLKGQQWKIHTVDNNGVGEYTSLALDATGHPNIAYYDAKNHALKYAAWKG
jgi:hypothetical protein